MALRVVNARVLFNLRSQWLFYVPLWDRAISMWPSEPREGLIICSRSYSKSSTFVFRHFKTMCINLAGIWICDLPLCRLRSTYGANPGKKQTTVDERAETYNRCKRVKTCNRCQARKDMQLMPKLRENMQPVSSAERHAIDAKRGKRGRCSSSRKI